MTVDTSQAERLALKQHRDQSVFGLTHWYARYQLPNAAASLRRPTTSDVATSGSQVVDVSEQGVNVTPVAQSAAIATQGPITAAPKTPTAPDVILESQTDHPIEKTQKPAKPKKGAPSVGSAETDAIAIPVDDQPATYAAPCDPFTLMVVQSGSVLMVDTVGSNVDSLTVTLIQKLASAIVSELDDKPQEMTVRFFQWPLFDHQYAPRDEAAARVVFTEFFHEFVGVTAVDLVLLCGDTAVRYTERDTDNSIALPDGRQVSPIVTHRLSSLLYSASDKRDLWLKLQALPRHV